MKIRLDMSPPGTVRRFLTAASLAALLLLLLQPAREAAAQDPYREAALELVGELIRLFPPAEGFVVSTPEGQVYVDLTEDHLMRPGMELLVYREGDDIIHPVTGDVLGKHEERVGYLTLVEVQEKYSVGTPAEDSGEMKPGDRVRISSRPLRALLLFTVDSPSVEAGRLAAELVEAARESQRFRLSDEPEWLPRLKETGMTIDEATADEASLRKLGAGLRSDLLLRVTPMKEDSPVVVLEARSLWTGRTLVELRQAWTPPVEPPPAAREPSGLARIFGVGGREAPPPKREYVTKSLPSGARSLAAGDLTGEGGVDILVSDGRGLTLYRWQDGGLIWRWEEKGPTDRRVLNLEQGDLDGDGAAEVIVTSVRNGWMQTEVLSWSRGEWHRAGSVDGLYLRVFTAPEGGRVILGQRGGTGNVFAGAVREYEWEGEGFREKEGLELPRGIDIFGLGLEDLDGDGTLEILSLSDEGRFRIYGSEGEKIWEGGERYGGYPAPVTPEDLFGPLLVDGGVTQGLFRNETVSNISGKDVEREILTAFQGRVLASDTDGGGRRAIVVPRNFSGVGKVLPNLRQLEKGEVALLLWEDGRLVEFDRSRRQEGYVADIALGDTDGDGRPEVLMAVNALGGPLAPEKGSLVIWNPRIRGESAAAGE